MNNPFSAYASTLLRNTTLPNGQSTLPNWLIAPLAILARQDAPLEIKDAGWIDENLVRKAIALYRAAGMRSGGDAAVSWQFSANGSQAVQVLPVPTDQAQQLAFDQLSRRLESVTLNHPRLAPILVAGLRQGYPFLAARIEQGFQSLTRRFGLPMEAPQAMRIAEQVVSALEYAHYRGVTHGSLDLGDILINERGQISLLGVGVEQLRQRLGTGSATLLSPLLPPEVESGVQAADERTDVYAVGALIYVLLTGRIPAAGQQVHLAQSLPAVPAELDALLTKALAEQPEERYASLMELGRALRVANRAPRTITKPSTSTAKRAVAERPATPGAKSRPPSQASTVSRQTSGNEASTRPDGFPDPLAMPEIDSGAFSMAPEMPQADDWVQIEIPPAPAIPKVDWAELLQLVDVSAFSSEVISLPYAAAETLAPDPLVAAAMAVKATEQKQQSREQQSRKPASASAAAPPPANAQPASKPAAPPSNKSKPQSPAKPRRVRRP